MTSRGPMNPESERLAREALRLLQRGEAAAPRDAVRAVLAGQSSEAPAAAAVRRHLDGLLAERRPAGEAARGGLALLDAALEVLAALEAAVLSCDQGDEDDLGDRPPPALYGRAAEGSVREDDTVSIRVVTKLGASALADALVSAGFAEPRCSTVETRFGRLDQIEVVVGAGAIRVRRIPPRARIPADRSLFRDAPTSRADYERLAGLLERLDRTAGAGGGVDTVGQAP